VAESLPDDIDTNFGGETPFPTEEGRYAFQAADLPPTSPLISEADDASEFDLHLGPVTTLLTSTAAVGFFSSATFHLFLLGAIILVAQLLGLNWLPIRDDQLSLTASLGNENVQDDLAKFEFVGEVSIDPETPARSVQQLAAALQPSDSGQLMTALDNVLNSIPGSDSENPKEDGSGFLLKIPESGLAVTKGSFTAFTIPANPQPLETYRIVIEVRLPDDVKKYRVSDLSGEVRGSDRYSQKLPFDSSKPGASEFPGENQTVKPLKSSTILNVVNNKVQIVVKVPGAAKMVRDVIRIRSSKLREEQELTLVFGAARNSSSGNDSSRIPEPTTNN